MKIVTEIVVLQTFELTIIIPRRGRIPLFILNISVTETIPNLSVRWILENKLMSVRNS